MTKREWMLAALLAVAGACVVRGVAYLTSAGAWMIGGVLLAGLAWLTFADVGEPAVVDRADES